MTYEKLSVEAFGAALLESGDLDPVYIALTKCEWPEERLRKWLMSYWCFYHPGSASYMADATTEETFWALMTQAAENDAPAPMGGRWPRASERRHFRGGKAAQAVTGLRSRGLADIFAGLDTRAPDYSQLSKYINSWPQFGPWMAFKVADMLERCCGTPVDFNLGSVTMFDDPKKAAVMVWKAKLGHDPYTDKIRPKDPELAIREVVEYLIGHYTGWSAPPALDRPVGYQEVETILCKWKSHMNGHYPLGKDTKEIREGLAEWAPVSESAREFLHWMPAEGSAAGDSAVSGGEDKVAAGVGE